MALTQINDRGLKTPIDLLDSEQIRFGTGNDFKIYDNGTDNYIIATGGDIRFDTGSAELARITQGGDIELPDNGEYRCGTGDDLKIYHNGTNSIIDDTGSGALIIRTDNALDIKDSDNVMMAAFNKDADVKLYYDGSEKLKTTSSGVTITGNYHTTGYVDIDSDSSKFRCGDGQDLEIYHNATDSYIQNNTGVLRINNDGTDLVISTDSNIHLRTNGTEEAVKCIADGAVELYYDNSKKFETTSAGGTLTGALTVTNEINLFNGTTDASRYIDAGLGDSNSLVLRGCAGGDTGHETLAQFTRGGAAELYHDNTKKFETTDTGVKVTGSLVSSNISGRNLVINGAMDINQYAASSTYNGVGTVDRWRQGYGGENEDPTQAKVALTSSDTGPWAEGFRNCFQITNGNQTSVDAADFMYIGTALEGFDIASSGWDYTSTSSYLTLTFWVKSSVAQNFYGYLCMSWDVSGTHGSRKTYTFQTGSLSANTWTKITKVIPGHADIKVDFNEKKSMALDIVPFYGTSYTDNSIGLDAWVDKTSNWMPDNTDTWWDTNDATFAITGVQLELGKVATPFDHVPYHQELLRCYRYYQNSFDTALGDYPGAGETEDKINLISWADGNAIGFHFFTEMRGGPTVTLWNGSTSGQVNSSGTDRSASAVGVNNKSVKYLNVTSGADTSWVDFQWEAKAEIV